MKKVSVLHTEASTGWGGQEIRVLDEMLGMRARGYELAIAAAPGSAIIARAARAGIDAYAVDMGRRGMVRGVRDIMRIIKTRKIAIINTHSSKDSWMGSVAGRLSGIKVLRTRHISSDFNVNPFTRLIYGRLCDGIITTGGFIKDQVVRELGINPRKVHPIPTGIDGSRFSNTGGPEIRGELGIPEGSKVIGIAAALRSWKGHEYILRAMPEVLREFPDTRLIVAGEGDMRIFIEGLTGELGISGAVIMTGHRDDINRVIAAFDISVMASYASEGVPQFALQSMAMGKPLIGTAVGGIPEVIKDGVNGIIVPPRDYSAIAAAVIGLLRDEALARRMGEEGAKMFLAAHTSEKMLDKLEALYGELLA
ncbi:MAG: glycosyltransferase family 4 protein [Nitrospirota bacterium]